MNCFFIFESILLVSWTSGLSTSDEKPPICNKKGRRANPKNSQSFYDCVWNKYIESFVVLEVQCPKGYTFDSSSESCVETLNKVIGSNASSGRIFNSNPKYKHLCKGTMYSTACADCQTSIKCTEGHAYTIKCEKDMRCVDNSPHFEGADCHTDFNDHCRCTSPNSYNRDPFSNSSFFLCEAKNSDPTYYDCLDGMFFDEITKTCVNNDGSPACTASGLFMFPENCAKYYMCYFARDSWVKKKLSCPAKQLFNQDTGMCEDPCNWELKEFKCETLGRFPNKKHCQRFFDCIKSGSGSLFAMMRYCPPGLEFNEQKKTCVARDLSNCKPHNEEPLNRCKKDFLAVCKSKTNINSEKITETTIINKKTINDNPDKNAPFKKRVIEEKPAKK